MSEKALEEFFREKKKAHGPPIDWERRKQEWIASVKSLYETITGQYLKKAIEQGLVAVRYEMKTVNENYMGRYEIPELMLQVDDETALFSPKGRNIVGGSGRIDLIGKAGSRTLIQQPGRWVIVYSRTPSLKLVPFDSDSLLQSLKDVMGQ